MPRYAQRGAVLLVSLVLLLILTTLAVTAASTSALQERMSSNAQQSNTAFQAAENGLANTIAQITPSSAPPSDQTYLYCKNVSGEACAAGAGDMAARARVAVAARVEDGYSIREGSGTPMVMTYDISSSASLDTSNATITGSNTNALHRQGYMTVEIR
jgi:type IV pilus assembly protein PilX